MRVAPVARFSMKYASGNITPDMWEYHPGGLRGFLRDLGEQLPDQFVITAMANFGMKPVRGGGITLHEEVTSVPGLNGAAPYRVYRLVAVGVFQPTRCVAEYDHHEHPHSLSCPLAGMA